MANQKGENPETHATLESRHRTDKKNHNTTQTCKKMNKMDRPMCINIQHFYF